MQFSLVFAQKYVAFFLLMLLNNYLLNKTYQMQHFFTLYFLGTCLSAKLLPLWLILGFDVYYEVFMQGFILMHLLNLRCSLIANRAT